MDGVPPKFQAIGQNSVTLFGNGLISAVNTQQQRWWTAFEQVGKNLWTSLANGFTSSLNANPLPTPAASGSGATAFAASSSTAATPASSPGGYVAYTGQKFGYGDVENYLTSKGYIPGTPAFNDQLDRMFALQAKGYAPPPDMVVTGRWMGGTIKPGEWSWVGERGPELIRAGSSGAEVRSHGDSVAMLAGARGGATNVKMNLNVDARGVQNADQMFQQIAPKLMRTVVNLLDAAERGAPDPAPETQVGA
jgi:hypothetical protein